MNFFKTFPKSAYFILCNTFLERVTSGGIFAILALYLNEQLLYSESISTAIFHGNDLLLHLATIFGAILADSYVGLYKSLFYMIITFGIGNGLLAIASLNLSLGLMRTFSFIAFIAICTGAGCCRCNYNVFGASQFKLPEELEKINLFYTFQFPVLKSGQVLGILFYPMIRESFQCFGRENCYFATFLVSMLLMVLSGFTLWKGKSSYVRIPPSENLFAKFCKCIVYAIKGKIIDRCMVPKTHFLDHAERKFGKQFVSESKSILNIIIIFLPQIIFWALVQQQSSRWVFQAKKMDRKIGSFEIEPDQLGVFVPIFIVILTPIFEKLLFPQIAKIGIKSPLQKMGCGMGCSVIAFLISAFIETQIDEQKLSIFLLLPQYILIAAAEVLVWISSVQFAYSQSPSKMKSVMNSFVYLVVAGGNLIVLVISGTQIFSSQVYEFLFFAFLMLLDAFAFVIIAMRYEYVEDVNITEI